MELCSNIHFLLISFKSFACSTKLSTCQPQSLPTQGRNFAADFVTVPPAHTSASQDQLSGETTTSPSPELWTRIPSPPPLMSSLLEVDSSTTDVSSSYSVTSASQAFSGRASVNSRPRYYDQEPALTTSICTTPESEQKNHSIGG